MAMEQGNELSELKISSARVGKLYPVLLDRHGNIIDGKHRLEVDENWPKVRLEYIETDRQLLLARFVSNVCRRLVSSKEKSILLAQLGEALLKEGIVPRKIPFKIAEETGMSYARAFLNGHDSIRT
jgi:hypothetical protein